MFPNGFPLRDLVVLFVTLQMVIVVVQSCRLKYRRLHGRFAPIVAARNGLLPSLPTQLYLAAVLLLALFPVWMLATAMDVLFGASRSLVFWMSLACLYVGYLALGFTGLGRRIEVQLGMRAPIGPAASDGGNGGSKVVAVVGAGAAGLVAAKELKEAGHTVVVYERGPRWGGVWACSKLRGGTAWDATITSTGALNTTLSDSLTAVQHAQNGDTPMHFSRVQFFDMLERFEARHEVFSGCLRVNTEVERLEPLVGGRWRIRSVDRVSGRVAVDEFDAVTICTGLNQDRKAMAVPGAASFRGELLHVDDLDPAGVRRLAKQRVVVVGTGESSSDLVEQLAEAGATDICVSHRDCTISLPRNYTTLPPDHVENRLSYSGPMFNRWGILLSSSPMMMLPLVLPTRVRPPSMLNWLKLFRPWRTIRSFPTVLGSVNVTKSDGLWRQLDAGTAHLVGGLAGLESNQVVFEDGTRRVADAVLFCTGYETDHAFLPTADRDPGRDASRRRDSIACRDLYKLTLSPDHANLAFVGFARGQVGAITLSSELQARWWARIVSEESAVPSPERMRRHIARSKRYSRRFAQPTRTTMSVANSIAREELGCEPDMFRLFLTDRELWLRTWCGPICSSHYRLHGANAKPVQAKAQLLMPGAYSDRDYIDSIDLFYGFIPLAAAAVPLWALYERLLPTMGLRSALRSFV